MRGFTLIEILVVIVIIAILSTAAMIAGRDNESGLALERSARQVASNMRLSLERTLRAEYHVCDPPGAPNFSGFGLYFSLATPDSYILFADCNANKAYNGAPPDEVVQTYLFEQGVEIQSVSPSPNVAISFVPPDPDIVIDPAGLQAQVVIRLISDPTKTRTITINEKGTIDIN